MDQPNHETCHSGRGSAASKSRNPVTTEHNCPVGSAQVCGWWLLGPRFRGDDSRGIRDRSSGFHMLPFLVLACITISLTAALSARAQEYPTRQITLIAPWPAGGAVDALCRA